MDAKVRESGLSSLSVANSGRPYPRPRPHSDKRKSSDQALSADTAGDILEAEHAHQLLYERQKSL